MRRDDLEREQDIETLRRIALAQQAQIERLLAVLSRQSRKVAALRGDPGELQLTLDLLNQLQAEAKQTQQAVADAEKKPRKERATTGPTPQPDLPQVERVFELDDADRACPSCGGNLAPMAGQFDESEMIDVVEVRYELVKVKQQKYVCRCGGCVETAIGPARALPGSRYSLAFAIKVCLDKWLDHSVPRRHGREVVMTD